MTLSSANHAISDSMEKLPSPASLVFVGDSLTAGVECSGPQPPEERYATVLTRLLQPRFPGLREVNLGCSGVPVCEANRDGRLIDEVLAPAPDMVVMQYGVNDCYWGYSLSAFAVAYEDFIRALRQARPTLPIVLVTLMAHFGWPDNFDDWTVQANVTIQEIAAKYRCHLADIHEAIDHDRQYYADMVHPNRDGHRKIAETILSALADAPLSKENLRLNFDGGAEIRFLGYVFLPEWKSGPRSWIKVSALSPAGLTIDTRVPVTIHIMTCQEPNRTMRLTIRDRNRREVMSATVDTGWKKAVRVQVIPTSAPMPYAIALQ